MRSILILTSYPLVDPKHGGQLRTQNICEQLRIAGWSVLTLAVFEEDSYKNAAPWDVVFPASSPHRDFHGKNVMFIGDLQTSKFVSDYEQLVMILSRLPVDLDVVHVEQPWLWPIARAYREKVNPHVVLSYGSQNIEYKLKRDILNSLVGDSYGEILKDIVDEIKLLEVLATREADLVTCVSSSDGLVHKRWRAQKLTIVPNGVNYSSATQERINHWSRKLGADRYLLYVASAHPPNFTNFHEIIGGSLACFPPNTKLVVVGSVSEHIYRQCLKGLFSSVNLSRLQLLFELDNADLDAIKSLAHGYFLPIPYGGGTNLKTAEALISEKHVVGTRAAFRGFEEYIDSPGVLVFETPAAMHSLVRHALTSDPRQIETTDSRRSLTWESCVQPMLVALSSKLEARR